MHSEQLGQAINRRAQQIRAQEEKKNVAQKKRVEATLTRDMKFICDATELGLPCLPVYAEEECKLFAKLIRLNNGHFDEDEMALEWVPYCNGMTIFPKLPLYLRWHHKNWLRNEETRAAIKKAAYK
jgi:hypothetical protein